MARAILEFTDVSKPTMIEYQNKWHDIEFKVGDAISYGETEVEIKGEKDRLIEFIKKEYDHETPEQWLVSDSSFMNWNYRVFEQDVKPVKDKYGNESQNNFTFIGECYYDEQNKPFLHSESDHSVLLGTDLQDLKDQYEMMKEAFDAPVVKLDKDGMFK